MESQLGMNQGQENQVKASGGLKFGARWVCFLRFGGLLHPLIHPSVQLAAGCVRGGQGGGGGGYRKACSRLEWE